MARGKKQYIPVNANDEELGGSEMVVLGSEEDHYGAIPNNMQHQTVGETLEAAKKAGRRARWLKSFPPAVLGVSLFCLAQLDYFRGNAVSDDAKPLNFDLFVSFTPWGFMSMFFAILPTDRCLITWLTSITACYSIF